MGENSGSLVTDGSEMWAEHSAGLWLLRGAGEFHCAGTITISSDLLIMKVESMGKFSLFR